MKRIVFAIYTILLSALCVGVWVATSFLPIGILGIILLITSLGFAITGLLEKT